VGPFYVLSYIRGIDTNIDTEANFGQSTSPNLKKQLKQNKGLKAWFKW
jgi:hypothetical protein